MLRRNLLMNYFKPKAASFDKDCSNPADMVRVCCAHHLPGGLHFR
jgi:hypothetical protein